jgi:hypothetical protein
LLGISIGFSVWLCLRKILNFLLDMFFDDPQFVPTAASWPRVKSATVSDASHDRAKRSPPAERSEPYDLLAPLYAHSMADGAHSSDQR